MPLNPAVWWGALQDQFNKVAAAAAAEAARSDKKAPAKGKPAKAARPTSARGATAPGSRSAEVKRIEETLRRRFGSDVKIAQSGAAKGEIRIPFYSADDFERVMELLGGTGLD